MVKKKIDYEKIEKSNILVLKTGNSVRVKFLNDGWIDNTTITDKETNETKEVDQFIYDVIDLTDNRQKELSFLAKTFTLRIKEYLPLKDKSFNISKYQSGTDPKFDIDFKITPI